MFHPYVYSCFWYIIIYQHNFSVGIPEVSNVFIPDSFSAEPSLLLWIRSILMLLSTRSRTPWPSLRRSTVVGTILGKIQIQRLSTSQLWSGTNPEHCQTVFKTWLETCRERCFSPLVVAVLASGLHWRALVVWRTDLLYLWDWGGVCRRREGAVWGGRGLHLLMGMGMMGVLAVVGARPGGGTTQRRTAADWLRVTTAALLPLTVLQQRHLRQQREERCC